MIDLNELAKQTLANAEKRHANGANVKTGTRSMLKHCATEVVEATEAYTDLMVYNSQIDSKWNERLAEEWLKKPREHFASELADIICCALIMAGKENLDIEKAILDCIEKNRKRAEGIGDKL